MNFERELLKIVEKTPGIYTAAIMGYDGIPISEYKDKGVDASVLEGMIEYARVMKECLRVADANRFGALQDVAMKTSKYQLIFRVLNEDYLFCAALPLETMSGKVKFLLNTKVPELLKAL